MGSYYLLRDAFGLSLWLSLALSSVGPAVRSVTGLVAQRAWNLLATLMLVVNAAGIAVSFAAGDWGRLASGSPRFRRLERLSSLIWGAALLTDCVARLVGAFTLPVTTMVWLSTVLTLGAIAVAILVSGVASGPIDKMIGAETAASAAAATRAATRAGTPARRRPRAGRPATR